MKKVARIKFSEQMNRYVCETYDDSTDEWDFAWSVSVADGRVSAQVIESILLLLETGYKVIRAR